MTQRRAVVLILGRLDSMLAVSGMQRQGLGVDGEVVVEDGRMTTVDEEALYAAAQEAGEAITARSGLPDKAKFPVY